MYFYTPSGSMHVSCQSETLWTFRITNFHSVVNGKGLFFFARVVPGCPVSMWIYILCVLGCSETDHYVDCLPLPSNQPGELSKCHNVCSLVLLWPNVKQSPLTAKLVLYCTIVQTILFIWLSRFLYNRCRMLFTLHSHAFECAILFRLHLGWT